MIVSFSNTIKLLRDERGFSQKDLAKRIGVSPSMVALYETGSRMPSFETLIRIHRVLGVSTDFLLGLEESDERSLAVTGLTADQIQAVSEIIEQYKQANGR